VGGCAFSAFANTKQKRPRESEIKAKALNAKEKVLICGFSSLCRTTPETGCRAQSHLDERSILNKAYVKYKYNVLVADGEMRECVDPEGNGVTMGRGAGGGNGPAQGGAR
jgi:hypothetical protein